MGNMCAIAVFLYIETKVFFFCFIFEIYEASIINIRTTYIPSISTYRGLGSDQQDKKNAATTIGYWIEAVINGSTLDSPDKCPELITERNVKVPEIALKVQKKERMLK